MEKEIRGKGVVRIMEKKEKKMKNGKRARVLFVFCVTIASVIVLCSLGWCIHYIYYLKTTTLIPELLAVAPKEAQDMVYGDIEDGEYYVLTREGTVVKDGTGTYLESASFAYFDGEKGKMWNSDAGSKMHREAVLDLYKPFAKVRGKEVTDWTLDMMTYPVYSVKFVMRGGNGPLERQTFWGVWSNGYLITNSQKIYKLDYDFSEFVKAGDTTFIYSDVDKDMENSMVWPILQRTSRTEDGTRWKADALKPGIFDIGEMEGLTMTVKDVDLESYQRTITIELRNDGTSDIKYGTQLHMETYVDGKWYQPLVDPTGASVIGTDSLMNTLHPGETKTVTYKVMAYQNPALAKNRVVLYVYKDDGNGGIRTHVATEI